MDFVELDTIVLLPERASERPCEQSRGYRTDRDLKSRPKFTVEQTLVDLVEAVKIIIEERIGLKPRTDFAAFTDGGARRFRLRCLDSQSQQTEAFLSPWTGCDSEGGMW